MNRHFYIPLLFIICLAILKAHTANACCFTKTEVVDDQPPKNWPAHVTYKSFCIKKIKKRDREAVEPLLEHSLGKVEIRPLPKSHPAFHEGGTLGLFCRFPMSQGEIIGEYTGLLRTKRERSLTSKYLIKANDVLYIDAEKFGNEMRFANDFHGVGPNLMLHSRPCCAVRSPTAEKNSGKKSSWLLKKISKLTMR